jgi:hypothetical protein
MKGILNMMVKIRDKKKNPDYNNLIHIPESKWKWTINAVTNKDISPHQMLVKQGGFQNELSGFKSIVLNNHMDDDVDIPNIDYVVKLFNEYTGPNKKFNNYKIERYVPRCITDKDYLWYIVKDPVGVYYTSKLIEEIKWYRQKVCSLESRLNVQPGYFIPSRFNHLKTFISKECSERDFENHLEYVLEGGDSNGK